MSNPESDVLQALDCLLLQQGISGVNRVLEEFEARIKTRFPHEPVQITRRTNTPAVGSVPLTATRSLPPGSVNPRRQISRSVDNSGLRRTATTGSPDRINTSPSLRAPAVIDMSDESGEDDDDLVQLPAPAPSTTLATPSLAGNGGHIFRNSSSQDCVGRLTSENTPATDDYPDFAQYRHLLRYRGSRRARDTQILHPKQNDIGDGDSWYYVTVGKNVGVFNTWAQVKHSTTGVADAAWKRVETRAIAYNVMENSLARRLVVVVNE